MDIDKSQAAVIDCMLPRIFVEAPAGYGKTFTMIEKIVEDFRRNLIPNPKKILALTFSVNAAKKMKNDIRAKLLQTNYGIDNRVDVYNYHALARHILGLYGPLLLGVPTDLNKCAQLNESQVLSHFQKLKLVLNPQTNRVLTSFNAAVRDCSESDLDDLINSYNQVLLTELIPQNCITYNGILTLAIKVLLEHESIQRLYRLLYPYVIVDEAQDTNLLSYRLLKLIVGDETRICMFGDSLQRIYGFIGAIPDFVERCQLEFGLTSLSLTTNHRFAKGSSMQLLDLNLRENIKHPTVPSINTSISVPLFFLATIKSELQSTCNIVKAIHSVQPDSTVAILLRSRGFYGSMLPSVMTKNKIDCFEALFEEDSLEYIEFNQLCIQLLGEVTGHTGESSLADLRRFEKLINTRINTMNYEHADSYKQLVRALIAQIEAELISASPQTKHEFAINIFENRALCHALEYIHSHVVITTMHSAKGLEWDYVIIPEMMQWVEPAGPLCLECAIEKKLSNCRGYKCNIASTRLPSNYADELCVFYVAVTRAKRNVIFLATTDRVNKSGEQKTGNLSCFLQRPGITITSVKNLTDLIM